MKIIQVSSIGIDVGNINTNVVVHQKNIRFKELKDKDNDNDTIIPPFDSENVNRIHFDDKLVYEKDRDYVNITASAITPSLKTDSSEVVSRQLENIEKELKLIFDDEYSMLEPLLQKNRRRN